MAYKDPKPDIQRIEELVNGVKNGEIRLPKFQRPFVWKRKEVLKLLDSIYKGYPIGSILLWQTSEQLESERTIADLDISSDRNVYPTNYLLDGQQRLSSLCGALYWNGKKKDSIWNVAFDLDKEEFIHPGDEFRIEYFPLNKLLNTRDFITQCSTFEAHPNKEKFFKVAEKLLRSVKDYKIAAVKIGDMTIHEVAPIFERINSTGRKLTIVDLMRAATWKGGFDLNDAISKVKATCESLSFFDVPDNHIIRNISACAGLGINREDIDKLRSKSPKELEIASLRCAESYSSAILFMKEKLPLCTDAFLPYGLQLTFMVEFFNTNPSPTREQEQAMVKWFWITAFSRHFGTSNTGQNTRDLLNIRRFARGEVDVIPVEREIMIDRLVFEDFRMNTANSKSFALLLAQREPISLLDGKNISLSRTLSVASRHEFFRLIEHNTDSSINPDACLNMCILNTNESPYTIAYSAKDFAKNLESNLGSRYEIALHSNFLNHDCITAIANGNYEAFYEKRKELLRADVELLTGRKTIPNASIIIEDDSSDELE